MHGLHGEYTSLFMGGHEIEEATRHDRPMKCCHMVYCQRDPIYIYDRVVHTHEGSMALINSQLW